MAKPGIIFCQWMCTVQGAVISLVEELFPLPLSVFLQLPLLNMIYCLLLPYNTLSPPHLPFTPQKLLIPSQPLPGPPPSDPSPPTQ